MENALIEIFEEQGNGEAATRVMARIESTIEAAPQESRHVLHRLPTLTDVFKVFQSAAEKTPDERDTVTSRLAISETRAVGICDPSANGSSYHSASRGITFRASSGLT